MSRFSRGREANVRSDSTSDGCFDGLFSGRGATNLKKSKKQVNPFEVRLSVEINKCSDSTATGCFGSLFSEKKAIKPTQQNFCCAYSEPLWLRSYPVKASVDKADKQWTHTAKASVDKADKPWTHTAEAQVEVDDNLAKEIVTKHVKAWARHSTCKEAFAIHLVDSTESLPCSSTLVDSTTSFPSFPLVVSPSSTFSSVTSRCEEEAGDNVEVSELSPVAALETPRGGGDDEGEEGEEVEEIKLLESKWQRFECRLNQDRPATLQMLFRTDRTVSFGERVKFAGAPPKPPCPGFCRPITDLPPRKLFAPPPPLEVTRDLLL
eukprot:g23500.t1